MALGWLVGLGLLVAAVWWLVTILRPSRRDPALDILRERYARGEISREEYEAHRRDLAA
jgi:putative membrane protein